MYVVPFIVKPLVNIKRRIITNEAPPIASRGRWKGPAKNSGTKWLLKTIIEVAPKAAPAETPINPGSANGFLKRPCKDAPERDKEAPTKPAKITLGALIWVSKVFCNGSNLPDMISNMGTE